MPQPAIVLTRRPVKEKGALMQTLHLRFRDLRAISLRQSLSRWRTPSDAIRAGMKGPPGLSNSPGPSCADGSRPAARHPDGILCPVAGAGVPGASRWRAARIVGPDGADPCRVCRGQTADVFHQSPAHHEAGEIGGTHRQARASESQRLASDGLSFSLRPQRSGERACGEKTVARRPDGSGTSCPGAPGFRPTGRLKPVPSTRATGPAHLPSCASTPALVTGQEPGGTGVPGAAQRRERPHRRCARAFRQRLSSVAG